MKRKAKRIITNSWSLSTKTVKIFVTNDDGLGTSVPPSLINIEVYFDQKGVLEVANDFFREHELRRWKNITGQPVINWKVCAAEWIYNYKQNIKRKLRTSPFYTGSS